MGTDIWFYVEKKHYRREYQWINGTLVEIPKSEKELKDTARWVSEDHWKVNPNYHLYPEERLCSTHTDQSISILQRSEKLRSVWYFVQYQK